MILQQLSEAIGISGKEAAVRKLILEAIREHVTDIRIDALGNLTAIKKGKGRNRPRVMLAAHMDEVGFMVTGVNGDGFIKFTSVGGIDDRILPALRVKVGTDSIPGVIIWAPIHKNRDQNTVSMSNLRIDIGASGKDEVNGRVKPGDRIAFDSRYMEIGQEVLRGKAFDDRAGCALLIDLLQGGPYPVDIIAAFTVQEEIGLRGAKVVAQTYQPDVALVLETTTANDIPNPLREVDDLTTPNPTARFGAGPVLTVMDRSLIVPPNLLKFLRSTAEKHSIPYQLKTMAGGGTDGGAIHKAGAGVPTAVIALPGRYIHTPITYIHRQDITAMRQLVQAACEDIRFSHFQG